MTVYSIRGLSMDKQESPQWCWVAACQSALRHYNKHHTQTALLGYAGVTGNKPGKPAKLLERFGVLDQKEVYAPPLDPIIAQQHAVSMTVRISSAIYYGRPVVIGLKQIDGDPFPFAHALVIESVDDMERTVGLLDPARPEVRLTATVASLMSDWQIYEGTPYDMYRTYSKYLFFTKPP